MNEQKNNEKPEIYALQQDGKNWQISRRDFLKAAGIGAAAVGAGVGAVVGAGAGTGPGVSVATGSSCCL